MMAQKVDQPKGNSETESVDRLKKVPKDMSLRKFAKTSESTSTFSDLYSDDFAELKKQIEDADLQLSRFKSSK
ncbi:MAG: hypothetical protein ACXAB7_11775 [Candidatus Kariarchaeaceae archaeon]|jgi:hypothetical protein